MVSPRAAGEVAGEAQPRASLAATLECGQFLSPLFSVQGTQIRNSQLVKKKVFLTEKHFFKWCIVSEKWFFLTLK